MHATDSRIWLSPPHVGPEERESLLRAFDSNWIAPAGPDLDVLEKEFCAAIDVAHAAAVSSGTAGLHLALEILGVGAGDEVLVPTQTFAATANAVRYVGATPVFIDSSPDTWTIDPALLEEELESCAGKGKLPKAVITVDLYGQCADYDAVRSACARYGVPLVEDAAEALGATYRGRQAGTFGDIGVFSFNGNKIITAGGGGMLVSDHREWAEKARFLATQARDPAPHYEHSCVGYNYRMSNLLAAVARAQLRKLAVRVDQRRSNNAFYRRAFSGTPGIRFMPEASYGRSTNWLTCITVDPVGFGATRDDMLQGLNEANIEARPVWKPMHLQPVFRGCRTRGGRVAEELFATGLCLPSGSSLTLADLVRVSETALCVPLVHAAAV